MSTTPDLALWNDEELQANMRGRLGREKAINVVEILDEIQALLRSLHVELSYSPQGIELLRRFRARFRQVRYSLPQSSLKERLDKLAAYNVQLQRLLTDRSLPSAPVFHIKSKPTRRFLRRDSTRAVDIYNAICDSYRCKCNAPHLAHFSFPKISDDTRTDSGISSGLPFELWFAIEDSAPDEACSPPHVELEGLMRNWSQTTIGGETVNGSRKISISEYDKKVDPAQETPVLDLCVYTRTLETEESPSDGQVGFLRLKEKRYQVHTPTTSQGLSSQNIECLDHLLASQPFVLSRKDRICLALNLSHAILSFYCTPWIDACWSWKDFCVDRRVEGQLFAKRRFYSIHGNGLVAGCRESLTSDFWAIHGEPILTRLGFALVELALGKRLAELRSNHQYQSSDPDTLDFLTAKTLIDSGSVMRAESQAYEDVVKVCLKHQFIRSSELMGLDSSRPSFQENAERSIIAPLHTIVTESWG